MKIKKIVAGMVASVMAASVMSIGASAYPNTYNWPSFNLHYSQTAPPLNNVTVEEKTALLYGGGNFETNITGQLTVDSYITELTDATVTLKGYVFDPNYNTWGLAVTFTRNTTGFETPHTGYYPISFKSDAKVRCIMNYNSASYDSKAKGKVKAY